MHVPPFRQGISRHSLRSTHPFPSDETTIPSPQLANVKKDEKTIMKCKLCNLQCRGSLDDVVFASITCTRTCSINPHIRMAPGRKHSSRDYSKRNIARCSGPLQLVPIVCHLCAAEVVSSCRPTCWRRWRER